MIVDAHNHLTDDFKIENAETCFKKLESVGVDRLMICAISHKRWGGNEATLIFKNKFPQKIITFAYIDLDNDPIEDIAKYKEQGFSGLKVIQTEQSYDHYEYLKYYEQASKLGIPILFHTGFLGLRPGRFVKCDDYRPISLDTIARHNPELIMLCAHMGNPWWDEAFLVMWKHKNIFCDMSGLSACRRDLSLWVNLFKPNGNLHEAISKLVFASDQFLFGSNEYSHFYIEYHKQLFNALGLEKDTIDKIFSRNFLSMIGEP